MKSILVTGCAGFIGFHVCRRLLDQGREILGLDNLNAYYDVGLKKARLAQLSPHPRFRFVHADLEDREKMRQIFREGPEGREGPERKFDGVVNLAAQAGVRHSLKDPCSYVDSNLVGFINVLEGCRHSGVKHLVFASSSSVYGANTRTPFSTHDNCDHPVSLYAATKKANELMAHSYAHLYRLPATGLRFFTVYGPWGRPDMALFLFTQAILAGEPIEVFNSGRMQRDFTYVDDAAEGVVRVLDHIPQPNPDWSGNHPDPATSMAPYRIYNLGNHKPIELLTLINLLEVKLGRKARMNMAPIQPGDVPATHADMDDLVRDTGFKPSTPVETGVERFVDWYRAYYGV
ncbi:MAG: NAD-dependent epimerase [Terriglobia bacterium]